MTLNSLRAHGFSTTCNGKIWAVGIGYEIGMDGGCCWDRWTLQDSITDSAPRLCSPFIGNHRIFVNLCGNSYGHQSQALEEAIACTYRRKSISWVNRFWAFWNSSFHLCREPVSVVFFLFFFHYMKEKHAVKVFYLQFGAKTNRVWPGWGAFYVTCV